MKFYYITFRSVTHAQRGESILKQRGIRCTLQRTPRWMEEQGCGYSLRVWTQDIHLPVALLEEKGVPKRRVDLQKDDGHLEEAQL